MDVIRASLAMLPRLDAEERLSFVAATAMGAGTLEASARRAIHRQWREATMPAPETPVVHVAAAEDFEALGIKVVRERVTADG